jgi:ribonuclease G
MSKELVISATPHETRVAIVEDGLLCEIYIEREKEFALVGSLYKGRVTRVLPGMQSAFVDIGLDSDAFLYVGDFLEHLEEYDHVPAPAEKPQRVEQPSPDVFPPSTIHGGVGQESNFSSQPATSAGEMLDEAIHSPSAEEAQGSPTQVPSSLPQQPPVQRNQPPYQQRHDRGRGNDRGNDRGGRGGRNRRWGKQGGGRDRRPNRELPSAKYAAPSAPDSRPRESQPYEPPAEDYVPIILPGESLAKYRDRAPGTPAATGMKPADAVRDDSASDSHAAQGEASSETAEAAEQVRFDLPNSLYAANPTEITEEVKFVAETQEQSTPAGKVFASESFAEEIDIPQYSASPSEPEPPTSLSDSSAAQLQNGSVLSEEDVSALAEQLAEAKHEEAQAEAEDRTDTEDTALEPFVDAAEIDDLQDALHQDHEDEAAEADAAADEMHDEALAADATPETFGDQNEHPEELAAATESQNAPGEPQPTSARISDQSRARFQRPMRRGGKQRFGRRGGRPDNRPRPPSHSQPHSQAPRHEQHRRPQLISEMLKAGEEIIVQIAKEPLGKKGARITSHVALPGRYLVYMPTVDHIGVSRRIGSAEDRSRLRRLVTEAKGTFPGGFIVRTAAGGATDEEIRADVEFLGRTWDSIRGGAEQRRAPALLHRDLNLVERILRDYLSDDYVAIWIDNQDEFTKVVEFVGRFQPRMVNRVKLYTKDAPIFEEFGIQQELDKALRPKVWLKSGGYIVINHTEALVAIDVNTGKYVGRGSTRLEDTIVKTNLEAVKEIVRQIRLRDLGGIIVADFIDMEERRNRDKVMAALDQALSQDRAPSKALSFNEFGLVCITRKRTKQALERVLCQPCPYCTGSGMVKSIPTICYEIQAEARKMSADLDAQSLTLRVNPEIAKTLKTRESSLIEELEQATRKSIIIQSDPTLHWEQYDIY